MKKSEFIEALREVKTNNTKSYLVHVSIIDLGIFDDLKIEDMNKFLFTSLVKIFGKNSTFSTMTPFYEYADKKKEFDLKRSLPSKEIGSFSKFIFNKKNLTDLKTLYLTFAPLVLWQKKLPKVANIQILKQGHLGTIYLD